MAEIESVYEEDIDFTPLLVPNIKFALRCETEYEALQFFTAVQAHFPGKKSYVSTTDLKWNNDIDGRFGGRAYFPDLNDVEHDPIMTGDMNYATENGYAIVYFKDLVIRSQIEESDMPLDVLFGSAK